MRGTRHDEQMVTASTPFNQEMRDGVRKRTWSVEQLHHMGVHVARGRSAVRTKGL